MEQLRGSQRAAREAVSKTVAIVQSNYIPWKGYFDLIQAADEFILYDDAQYTKRDWRSRNRIKSAHGLHWLSIPVVVKGRYRQAVMEARIADPHWSAQHWSSIRSAYARAPHFREHVDVFEPLYLEGNWEYLSQVNHAFIARICALLRIRTTLSWSMDFEIPEAGASEKLLALCQQAGATEYLSGPAARDYLDTGPFERAGIRVRFFDYSGYPEYPQIHPPFEHAVSILDLLFNTGREAQRYMKGAGPADTC